MSTTTGGKRAVKAAPKAAKKSGAASTKTAAAVPKKAAASKPAPAKKAGQKPQPVEFAGAPAMLPHFRIDRAVYEAARARAGADGVTLAAVVRHGLVEYAEGAQPGQSGLPVEAVGHVRDLWEAGDRLRINGYFAALARAGWPLRTIAEAVVQAGLVPSMSRQGMHDRITKVDDLPPGLPPVPPLLLRRSEVGDDYDLSARIPRVEYRAAVARAKAEGAQLAAVVQDVLTRFTRGEYPAGLAAAVEEPEPAGAEARTGVAAGRAGSTGVQKRRARSG